MKTVCKTCAHSIFCSSWGGYKCVLHSRKFIIGLVGCKDFKERGKDFEIKTCQCDTCQMFADINEEMRAWDDV